MLLVEAGGVLGSCGVGSGVGSGVASGVGLHRLGGGTPVPLCLQPVSRFFAVRFWQRTNPAISFCLNIAGCLSEAAFTLLCPRNITTPLLLFSDSIARIHEHVLRFLYCSG